MRASLILHDFNQNSQRQGLGLALTGCDVLGSCGALLACVIKREGCLVSRHLQREGLQLPLFVNETFMGPSWARDSCAGSEIGWEGRTKNQETKNQDAEGCWRVGACPRPPSGGMKRYRGRARSGGTIAATAWPAILMAACGFIVG